MINLETYRDYWTELAGRIPELTGVCGVTVDENMAKRIQGLPLGSMTLFWLPPNAEGTGTNVDNYRDTDLCVVFVMEKYDPSRTGTIDVLIKTQRTIERVKALILDSQRCGCSPVRLWKTEITTLPETKFFAGFAGWSIAFKALSSINAEKVNGRIFTDVFSIEFN